MELIPENTPFGRYVWADPERMGGEPLFRDTRVPVKSLFDHLKAGVPLDTFLDHFEGVTREQARGVIELAAGGLLQGLRAA